ncbi:hypothetical protein HFO56_33915 [Rhizobium laguerreae]|nr:hypothetical protein [Rhizobium laguerreae]MBY3157325.1 hypothetical protein [Rhizobium laguerreae]
MKIVFPLFCGITGRLPGKRAARTYAFRELMTAANSRRHRQKVERS